VTLGAGASTFSHWRSVNWSERGCYVWCNAAFLCQQLHGRADAGLHVLRHHSNGARVLCVIMTKKILFLIICTSLALLFLFGLLLPLLLLLLLSVLHV
jgi:hypothetical protein